MRERQKKLKIAGVILFTLAVAAVTIVSARWVLSLRDPVNLAAFQSWIETLGPGGWLLLLAIQYVQIVVAFIPGGPIQIVAGALLGPWGGLAVCFGGTLLATATVFYLVSRFGHSVISLFVDEQDILKYKFLNDKKRLEWLVLVLFFIPGTPKDALTYLFALTKIKMSRFLLLSMLARTPAIVTSLLAGDSIVSGKWSKALILFVIMTVISGLGLLLHRKLMGRFAHKSKPESD